MPDIHDHDQPHSHRVIDLEVAGYATFHQRLLATLLDTIILIPVMYPLFWLLNMLVPLGGYRAIVLSELPRGAGFAELNALMTKHGLWGSFLFDQSLPLFVLMGIAYLCWRYKSTTPGKFLMRLVIVDAKTGGVPSGGQWLRRLVGYVVSSLSLGLGFLWIGLDKRKQAWHDLMADTLVVVDPERYTLWELFKYYVLKRRENASSSEGGDDA